MNPAFFEECMTRTNREKPAHSSFCNEYRTGCVFRNGTTCTAKEEFFQTAFIAIADNDKIS
jgi:hypothetical protein